MFQSIEPVGYLGYDKATYHSVWECEFVDSEFKETVVAIGMTARIGQISAIIDTYEKRNISPVLAIIKFMQYMTGSGYDIKWVIDYHKQNNPKFLPYAKDIEKYLILL